MDYKKSTRTALIECYNQYGLDILVKAARGALADKSHSKERLFVSSFHGEIAETVLELQIKTFMQEHPKQTKNWVLAKSIILPDADNTESEFLTELDLVLFTPQQVFLFECKSYNADKTISGKGTLECKGKKFDVFSQNSLHAKTLQKLITKCRTTAEPQSSGIQMILFDFALGKTIEKRSKQAQMVMPCINETKIEKLLSDTIKIDSVIWDMRYIEQIVEVIIRRGESLRRRHLQYVRSLHGGKRNE